jgi:hypothetical protein
VPVRLASLPAIAVVDVATEVFVGPRRALAPLAAPTFVFVMATASYVP